MLGEHLSGCAECRRAEAVYRQTGEHIRQLPTITPPDSFRAAVFAAIRAEDARLGRGIAGAASDDTQPNLPALRPLPARTWSPRGAVLGARAAIAVAAVLLIGLAGARLAPTVAASAPHFASSLASALSFGQSAGPHIVQYEAPSSSTQVTAAMASGHWLVYTAKGTSGHAALYARERGTSTSFALPGASTTSAVTLRAVTDRWVIWQAGSSSGTWTLWATPLGQRGSSFALLTSQSASGLSGVWAQGNAVLATYTTPSDGSVLARFDLASGEAAPQPSIIAHAQVPTHTLANPSLVGGTYYWSEVWQDADATQHSDIWRLDSSVAARAVTTGGTAFAPHTTSSALIWVDATSANDTDASHVGGTLRERPLTGGAPHQIAAHAVAGSLQVAGPLILWSDGSHLHTYDLAHSVPSAVDASIRAAGYASANGGSLTWGQTNSPTINIYDGR